ncbi:HD domain-containing protein [Vibrio algivorus]|uniref:Phosphohydrolase n=1 Tax=Vibrio algivorus TaxID=1667024 RepID=A0ABQ6EK64_9VIBR|nr:HD domain-containing protein [Vibrio algivorus]GLT13503.1 phosphohydrolase [Vibrio algivorus]
MLEKYESEFERFISVEMIQDPAHDLNHVLRVVQTARKLCQKEQADLLIVLPAAYLHDCFTFPKNHPERASSSAVAAEKADQFLRSINYPVEKLKAIKHAIIAHSFSAGIKPTTIEAQIVQDADRLDALGAIGVSRCLQVSSSFGASLYHSEDPYAKHRGLDDKSFTLDHFQVKLFKLAEQMHTSSAKQEAARRVQFMKLYIQQLGSEM